MRPRHGAAMVPVVAVLALPALAMAGATAWACTPTAALAPISPAGGEAGTRITVAGQAFQVADVAIRWGGAGGPLLGTAKGPSFSVSVTVPDAAPGVYLVVAIQPGSSNPRETFEVTRSPDPSQAPSALPPAPAQPAPAAAQLEPAPAAPAASTAGDAAVASSSARPAPVEPRPTASPAAVRGPGAGVVARAAGSAPGASGPAALVPSGPPVAPATAEPVEAAPPSPPSPRSAAADLWSGFASPHRARLLAPYPAGPSQRASGSPATVAAVVASTTAALAALAFVAALPLLRRRRVRAGRDGAQ